MDELINAIAIGNIEISGKKIEYEAVSEEYIIYGENGQEEATIFMTAYICQNTEKRDKPILFAYNGGPGSASIFLNIGGLGPRIIDLGDGVSVPFNPPFSMKDNKNTVLDICDLVFIDPIGCGFSRILTKEAVKKYASSQEDAKSMICGINNFLSRHKRWNCPVFLLGESYGTVRAALMAEQFYENQIGNTCNALNIHIAGLILIGSLLDRDKSLFPVERAVTNFPSIAAAHWYNMKGEKPLLKKYIEDAEEFAFRKYLTVLALGKKATEKERKDVLEALISFTGLSQRYFEMHGLRLTVEEYLHENARNTGRIVSPYDSRFASEAFQKTDQFDSTAEEPYFERIMPAFTHCYYGVVKEALGITTDRDYQYTNLEMNENWKFDSPQNPIHFVENAMRKNQKMKVMFVNGYYDMLTTYSYSEYMINTFDLPLDRTWHKGYESGHMPCIGEGQSFAVGEDLRRFIKWVTEK